MQEEENLDLEVEVVGLMEEVVDLDSVAAVLTAEVVA
jgi:hypothetical protein